MIINETPQKIPNAVEAELDALAGSIQEEATARENAISAAITEEVELRNAALAKKRNLISGHIGENSAAAGWWRIGGGTLTNNKDVVLSLHIVSTYGDRCNGSFYTHLRSNTSKINAVTLAWEHRYGWNHDDLAMIVDGFNYNIYINYDPKSWGRIYCEAAFGVGRQGNESLSSSLFSVSTDTAPAYTETPSFTYVAEDEAKVLHITPRGAFNINELYTAGLYEVQNGSGSPSKAQYGIVFTLPYNDTNVTKGTKPNYGAQIFFPNGDETGTTGRPDTMFYRTSEENDWHGWRSVISSDANNKTIIYVPGAFDYQNNSWITSADTCGLLIGDPERRAGNSTGYYIAIDGDDIQAKRNTGSAYQAGNLYINDYGGKVYLGKKTGIFDNGLAVIQLPGKMEYIPSTGETSTSDEWAARADACGLVIGDPYRKIVGNDSDIGKYIAIDGNDIQAKRNKGNNQYEVVDLYVQDYGAYLCVPKFKFRKNAEDGYSYAANDDWNNTITVANGDGYTSEIKRSAYVGRAYDERISWFPSGSSATSRSSTGTSTLNSKLTPNYLAHNFSKLVITGYANGHVYSSVYDIQEVTKAYNEANAQLLEIRAGDKGTNRRVSCKYYYDGSKPYFKVDTLENWDSVSIRFIN